MQTPWAEYTHTRVGNKRKQSHNSSKYTEGQTHESHNGSVPYGSFSADPVHSETPPPLDLLLDVVKTHANTICTGLRSKEVKK